jgi:L-ascorbate metabolism protein UlaG (beta-lactamase superfamily)
LEAFSSSLLFPPFYLMCYNSTMDITYFGHSCFRIRGSQSIIITDPVPPSTGYTLGKQTADIVTVSHQDPSHSYIDGVTGAHVIKGPGEYEVAGVLVLGINTYHDGVKGQKKGKNTVYLMEVDGVNICHVGDLGHLLTDAELEEIGHIDILFVPVGGVSTINANMAAQLIRKMEPKLVIPMHYKTDKSKRDLEPVDNFIKEMGMLLTEPKPKLSVTKNNLPLTLQVTVLIPA